MVEAEFRVFYIPLIHLFGQEQFWMKIKTLLITLDMHSAIGQILYQNN